MYELSGKVKENANEKYGVGMVSSGLLIMHAELSKHLEASKQVSCVRRHRR